MQITFYYSSGNTESFTIAENTNPEMIQKCLNSPSWMLQTPEDTVYINMANVLKVELRPPLSSLQGEAVFLQAERLTALTRGSRLI